MPAVAGLEAKSAIGRGQARVELPRLRHRPAGQLVPADTRREAKVVLDPPRRARLAADRAAVDDERLEALGRTVDRGAEPGGSGAHNEQVDLLPRLELTTDPERAMDLAGGRAVQLDAARQPHERQAVHV